MTSISITDLNNAKTDVDHIAEISTSVALTATDRLGNVKDTLTGAMYKVSAFNSRGPWVTATNYAIKDLVSNAGTWYVCVATHTSSAAFATDTATKWRVYQGVIYGDLAAPSGSSLSGYLPAGIGAVSSNVQKKLREAPSPEDQGCIGDGVTIDTANLQLAVNAAKGKKLYLAGNYLIDAGIDFSSWTGKIYGPGKITCKAGVSITNALYFASASNIEWTGVSLDMGQNAGTLTGGAKATNGFYLLDARDCKFGFFGFSNVKFGNPVYVDGTSGVSPSASAGSKRIFFESVTGIAISSGTLDDGANVNIRSDFFTGTGGGLYAAASNGNKVADYLLDATVAYQRTTENVFFSNCHFENLDRFAGYNAKGIHLTNVSLVGNYTRGMALSPCCENVTWNGGKTSGNAAQVNANYSCKDVTISNLVALGETVATGQRHALRCGFGSERIKFSNITGSGNDTRHVYVEGARDVTFENVSLYQWSGGNTTVAVSISGGADGNTSNWVTDRIKFIGCDFSSNYAFRFDDNASGTATVADGAVVCDETCRFNIGFTFFNGVAPVGKLTYHGSGSWTPIIIGESVAGTQTYTQQQGKYRRKGDLCYYEFDVKLAAKDAAMAGGVSVSNFPFTSSATSNAYGCASIGYANGFTFPANFTQLMGLLITNTALLRFYRFGSGQATAIVQAAEISGTTEIAASGQYITKN